MAVGYVRCSTDMQAETSPDQQKTLISEWAEKNGYQISEWFVDIGKSGTSFEKRPEFSRLKSRVESKPEFQAVIVLDESRWGRAGASDSIYYKTLFKKVANVDVLIMRTIANTGNSGFDTVLGAFEGHLSQEESKKKSERTYDGCLSAVRQGHSAGGTAPFGYQRVAVNRFTGERRPLKPICNNQGQPIVNEKGLQISEQIRPKEEYVVWDLGDPKEIAVVKRIFELRTQFGYGYTKIAKQLNAEGVACPQRGRWANKNQLWSAASVGAIIRNPAYRGARAYDRLKKRGIGKFAQRYWVQDSSRWTVIENAHPAIVTPEEWEAANPLPDRSNNGRLTRKRFDNPYLLSGMIRCTQCGFHFHGRAQNVGTSPNRRKRRTYQDSGYASKGACRFMAIDADRLEAGLVNYIRTKFSKATGMSVRLELALRKSLDLTSSKKADEETRIDTQLKQLKSQIASLVRLAEQGVQVEEIAERIRQLEAERRSLEQFARRMKNTEDTVMVVDRLAKEAEKFFEEFGRRFEKSPVSEQKALIQSIVQRIDIDRERRVAKCYVWKLPKIGQPALDFIRTHLLSVPPTGFEPVLQA